MSRHWLLITLALLASGCAGEAVRPDLVRLYASSRDDHPQPPVVVIHGILGAKMRDRRSGEEIWPGSLTKLLTSDYQDLAVPLAQGRAVADQLEPYALFESAAGQDFYGEIIRVLASAGGYAPGVPGAAAQPGERRYYVLTYDWRQDNVQAAGALDRLIEQIRQDYGDPYLRVDLVAHSMGGLVSRYYLRYGSVDLLDGNDFPVTQAGATKVRRAILLGTPNFGSVTALTGLIEGVQVGLRKIPPEVLASMPSAPQLFPHALHDWLITADGRVLDRDQFDVELWRRFQWGPFNPAVIARIAARDGADAVDQLQRAFAHHLERARRFTWALSVPIAQPKVPLIVFGGSCQLTPARLLVEEEKGESMLRLWPGAVKHPQPGVDLDRLMLEPGDGTVTKASLLARDALDPRVPRHRHSFFPLDYAVFLCERHDRLTGNPSFQDNLLQALLAVDAQLGGD
ncbi:MAG: hypothetical protein KDI71_01805 [Xanthomonadales bacterium]|nr:hypothetical protein [Xanthomonadales bacterium]